MSGKYYLYPKARYDLEMIWLDGLRKWGEERADLYLDGMIRAFDDLCEHPRLHRERTEFSPPVRICHHKSHLIVYVVENDDIHIIRVLHKNLDVLSLLKQ